jgi:ABC-type multidrug transport system ATPase subunit
MLEICGITASYGSHKALDDVTLTVGPGDIVGIVGPNGAGKTTLFKVIARILKPDTGTVTFNEQPLAALKSNEIGYLAEAPFQFDFFTPTEMLLFERALKNPQLPAEQVSRMIRALDLEKHKDTPLKRLSQGLRKRVAIAAAFLGTPSILVLDEPLNAIDIQTVIALKRLIQEAAARGAHVLVSTHVLDFFDDLIKRVVFLNNGNIYYVSRDDTRGAEELYTKLFISD